MMKKYFLLLLAVILLVPAGTAFAGPMGRGMGGGMGMGPGYGLGPYANTTLSSEQSSQVLALRERYLKEVNPLQSEMFSKRSEMRVLYASAKPDAEKITALQKDMLTLQGKLQEKRLQYNLEYRKILNP